MVELIFQGAEARLFKSVYLERKVAIKERFTKSYRHPVLDQSLLKSRTRSEVRNLVKARAAGLECPVVYGVRFNDGIAQIIQEWIEGSTLATALQADSTLGNNWRQIAQELGLIIAKLHEVAGVIHGDLTTSNIMISPRPGKSPSISLIDFGLAHTSLAAEDKAVDLYVLERAIQSLHPTIASKFTTKLLKSYEEAYPPKTVDTIKRLAVVRARGRKRVAFG